MTKSMPLICRGDLSSFFMKSRGEVPLEMNCGLTDGKIRKLVSRVGGQ